jgi:tetratricopeptide (TPR) repeat protein
MTFVAPDQRAALLGDGYVASLLTEAEALCRQALSSSSLPDAGAFHLRGLLALKMKQLDFAVACFARAVVLRPDHVPFIREYAFALCQAGRHAEAEQTCQHALAQNSGHGDLHEPRAIALFRSGRIDDAAESYHAALKQYPTNARLHCALAAVLEADGRVEAARAQYEEAKALAPEDADVHLCAGRSDMTRRDWLAAISLFRQGLVCAPGSVDLRLALGEALLCSGRSHEALAEIRAAIAIDPYHAEGCRLLVFATEIVGSPGDLIEAWSGLGEACESHDQFHDAGVAYTEALRREPKHLRALLGMSWSHLQDNRPDLAIPLLETILTLEPQHMVAHLRIGWAHALLGNLERHWQENTWYDDRRSPWRRFVQPWWDGADLRGRTILLWQEGGIGDTIQQMRFVPQIKDRGATVIVECERGLVPLLARLPCVDRVTVQRTPPPAFDTHVRLGTLRRLLDINLSNLPHDTPYLWPDEGLVDEWRRKLIPDGRPLIGIAWAGHPNPVDARFRFASLNAFAPLAELRGVRWISLQLGPQAEELIAPPPGFVVEQVLGDATTLDETAALIHHLDLVIAVDTMVVHLAGAFGQQVWTLLPFAADWKWLLNRNDSPWYPTMRLFRQPTRGDWTGVMRTVRAALEAFLAMRA